MKTKFYSTGSIAIALKHKQIYTNTCSKHLVRKLMGQENDTKNINQYLIVFGLIKLPQKYELERDVVVNFVALMAFAGIITNGLLLLIVIKDPFKKLRTITAILLAFTSASNLTNSLVLFLDDVFYWCHETLSAELILYSGLFTSCLYIVGNALHSVNIYSAIVAPVRYAILAPKVRKVLVKSLISTWVIVLVVVIIPPYTLPKDKVPSYLEIMLTLVCILLASFVILFGCLYTKIFQTLYARKQRLSLSFHLKRSTVRGRAINKKNQNIVKTLFIHVFFFIITTLPGCIVFLIFLHCSTCDHVALQLTALFTVPLTYSPVIFLPLLWLFRLRNYRKATIRTFRFFKDVNPWRRRSRTCTIQGSMASLENTRCLNNDQETAQMF